MKKIITIICLSIALLNFDTAQAQKTTTIAKVATKEAVKILNTGKRAVVVMANFLTPAITASILKQISAKQFQDFKMHCNEEDYPVCIKWKLEFDPEQPEKSISEVTLKSLKLYRIAKFKNIQNGEDFGERSILVAPAKENKNVGGDCNYDKDFYIIIPSEDIELLK
jgi:SHS2 domain-containing protein